MEEDNDTKPPPDVDVASDSPPPTVIAPQSYVTQQSLRESCNMLQVDTRKMFYKGHLIRATLLTTKCLIKLLPSYVNKAHFILAHRDSTIYLSNMKTFRGHLRGTN